MREDFDDWCERKGYINPDNLNGITPFKNRKTIHPDDKKYLVVCAIMILTIAITLIVNHLWK